MISHLGTTPGTLDASEKQNPTAPGRAKGLSQDTHYEMVALEIAGLQIPNHSMWYALADSIISLFCFYPSP